jgi:hypothetical protein
VISCFSLNIYRIVQVCNRPKTEQTTTAAQRQEQLLKEHRGSKTIKPINHDIDRTKEQN